MQVECERLTAMASSLVIINHCLCVLVVLGLCSAVTMHCPASCKCLNETVYCRICPNSYFVMGENTRSITVKGCDDLRYFLKLPTGFVLPVLEITDSYIIQPESFIYNNFDVQRLVLRNNSIKSVNPGTKLTNMTYLDLSHNKLLAVENRTFATMKMLQYLNLSANVVANLSDGCFEGLDKLLQLDLSSNNLTCVSDVVFLPLCSLQQLNLSSNKLEVISERSFSSLLLLQQLDISYNRLTSVAPGTLQFLPNLAKLLMTDNPQLKPDAQIFVGTGARLQQVDASRTGLSQVPEALTHSVRYLTLAGNRIAFVRCGDLDSYPLLQMLDFTNNIIFDIEDDALGRLEMLSHLNLDVNELTSVPKMLPDKLQYLSIDNNRIGNLTTADFASLTNLKTLVLSNNNISYIQENTFVQLISLQILDLSNNPLKALTPNTFSGPVSLKDLRIAYVNISPPAKDISFPVPSPEGIENLYLEFSPGLTRQLMADTAALAAMTRLQRLDIRFSNIAVLRSDLLHFLPGLRELLLEGNRLDCTEIGWLSEWMRENPSDNYERVKCSTPQTLDGKLVKDLRQSINPHSIGSSNAINASIKARPNLNKNASSTKYDTEAILRDGASPKLSKEGRSKLLQIFSEWSQEPRSNPNKTKCSREHPKPDNSSAAELNRDNPEKLSTEIYADDVGNLTEVEVHVVNASESRTSRFSAEASSGGVGVLAALGVVAAIVAAVAATWAARRRPRHQRPQDLMEVPTIAAVGELW